MKIHTAAVLVAALCATAPQPAAADDASAQITMRGRARGTGAASRTAAIDQAFAGALEQILEQPLGSPRGAEVRDALVRRARRFVRSYQVVRESDQGGTVEVNVAVTVDLDKVRAELGKLGLALPAPRPVAAPSARPRAVLLVKAGLGERVSANFGAGGEDGEVSRALADDLGNLGFDLVSAIGQPVPVAGPDSGESLVPLGDEQAAAVARAVGVPSVVVVGVDARPDGRIRSTKLSGAVARGAVRVLSGGDLVAEAQLDGAGFDDGEGAALGAAAREVGKKLMGRVAPEIARRFPPAAASADTLVVSVHGQQTWAAVSAVVRTLAATAGIDAINVREARAGAAALGLATGLGAVKVAAALRGLTLPSGQLSVRPRGDRAVEVLVRGDAPFPTGPLAPLPPTVGPPTQLP